MASIRIEGLTKRYGDRPVVDNVSLDIGDHEFLVLLGPSGCGKSTLLRMLAGLEVPSSGRILMDGAPVEHLPPGKRDMAFVFQSYALYPHMTVRRNIGFPLIMRRFPWWFHIPGLGAFMKRRIERTDAVREPVENAARILGLSGMLDRLPKTLSGGQRQRVALGRAMVRKPAVFLMDEPLSNLDTKLRGVMRAEISKLHTRVGGTFVYVTHDQVEAMTMGTHIALMRNGAIQQFGIPRDIYERPANTYVARFVGNPAMNLIVATLMPDAVKIGELMLPRAAALAALPDASRVLLGVRPNALVIGRPPAPGLAGTVTLVEHLGVDSIVTVRLANAQTSHAGEDIPDAEIMVVVPDYSDLAIGDAVSVGVDPAKAVYFDSATGMRLG